MRTVLISWTIVINGQILEFKSLTSIDPVTNIAEFIRIESKTKPANMSQSKQSARKISKTKSKSIYIHDNEGEFLGYDLQELLGRIGVQSVPTTLKNP